MTHFRLPVAIWVARAAGPTPSEPAPPSWPFRFSGPCCPRTLRGETRALLSHWPLHEPELCAFGLPVPSAQKSPPFLHSHVSKLVPSFYVKPESLQGAFPGFH